jgi:predicted RNA-binding protein with RPS1 domain
MEIQIQIVSDNNEILHAKVVDVNDHEKLSIKIREVITEAKQKKDIPLYGWNVNVQQSALK